MELQEIQFIFNTFSFLVNGILVMLMAAGFCMLEAGMVRSKSVATICTKNIVLYSIAGLLYFFIGFLGPRRHLESFLEPVASFSQSMSPWRATATPFMSKMPSSYLTLTSQITNI